MLMPVLNRSPECSHSLPGTLKEISYIAYLFYVLLRNKTYFYEKKKKIFTNLKMHEITWNFQETRKIDFVSHELLRFSRRGVEIIPLPPRPKSG